MILKLKQGETFELGKDTGILLEDQIIKIVSTSFTDDLCILSLFYYKDEESFVENKSAFTQNMIKLTFVDLAKLKETIGDIFILENNSVVLNPDNIDKLLSLIKIDDKILGEKYEAKIN